jgi:acyl-CoA thioester hydrolase
LNPFLHEANVEFCHTDAAGIAHFSSLMQYVEQAEHAFLRSLGLSVFSFSPGSYTWPRVKVSAEFLGPAFFEDKLKIELRVKKLGVTSVTYAASIFGPSGRVAECETVCVCCKHSANSAGDAVRSSRLEKTPIPLDIHKKLSLILA